MPEPKLDKDREYVVDGEPYTLVQTAVGYQTEHLGQRFTRRTVTVGRVFEVRDAEGTFLGQVTYDMRTRERRTAGRTYVNSRWHAPAWASRMDRFDYALERFSKKDAVEDVVRTYKRRKNA